MEITAESKKNVYGSGRKMSHCKSARFWGEVIIIIIISNIHTLDANPCLVVMLPSLNGLMHSTHCTGEPRKDSIPCDTTQVMANQKEKVRRGMTQYSNIMQKQRGHKYPYRATLQNVTSGANF